jgi:hypothetical protein
MPLSGRGGARTTVKYPATAVRSSGELSGSSPASQNFYADDDSHDSEREERQTPEQHRGRICHEHGAVGFATHIGSTEGAFGTNPIDQTKAPRLERDDEIRANKDCDDADGFTNHVSRCWITDGRSMAGTAPTDF